jgi:hypothetical protein
MEEAHRYCDYYCGGGSSSRSINTSRWSRILNYTRMQQRHENQHLTQSPGRIKMSRGISIEDQLGELSLIGHSGDIGTGTNPSFAPSANAHASTTAATATGVTTGASAVVAAAAAQAAEDHQVGIIASGFAWVDRQRERRRREYLQSEAEKQLQKIAEAEFARKAALLFEQQQHNHHTDSPGRARNPNTHHAQNNHHSYHRSPHDQQQQQPTNPENTNNNNSTPFSDFRDPGLLRRDGSDEHHHHHHPSPEENIRIGKPDISKSGEGASAQLEDLLDVLGNGNNSTVDNHTNNEFDDRQDGSYYENDDNDYYDDDTYDIPEVRVDRVAGDSNNPFILTPQQMHEIACKVLPKTIAFCRWRRLYGLNRDGDSFDGCIRIIGSAPRTLMVIRTTKGAIFGGFTDTPWMSHDHNNARFYGSSASCLFSFSSSTTPTATTRSSSSSLPSLLDDDSHNDNSNNSSTLRPRLSSTVLSSSSVEDQQDQQQHSTSGALPSSSTPSSTLNVYRWTGRNRYIQLCDVTHKMLAFGGGGIEGAFGLCVQEDFTRGSTGPCDTFGNAPLCEDGSSFEIVDVEFWEFLTGVF